MQELHVALALVLLGFLLVWMQSLSPLPVKYSAPAPVPKPERHRGLIHVYPLPSAFNTALRAGRHEYERPFAVEELVHARLQAISVPADRARLFLVPVYASAHLHMLLRSGAPLPDAVAATKDLVSAAVRHVSSAFPYWHRREGRDHLFVFASPQGRCALAPPAAALSIAVTLSGEELPVADAAAREVLASPVAASTVGSEAPTAGAARRPSGVEGCDIVEAAPVAPPSRDVPTRAMRRIRRAGRGSAASEERCFHRGVDIVVPPLAQAPSVAGSDGAVAVANAAWRGGFCVPPLDARWSVAFFDCLLAGNVPLLLTDDEDAPMPFAESLEYGRFTLPFPRRCAPVLNRTVRGAARLLPAMREAARRVREQFDWHSSFTSARGVTADEAAGPLGLLLAQLRSRARTHAETGADRGRMAPGLAQQLQRSLHGHARL